MLDPNLLLFFVLGCTDHARTEKTKEIIGKLHSRYELVLSKVWNYQESKISGHISGSFFVLVGGVSGSVEGEQKIVKKIGFAWKDSGGFVRYVEVPIGKASFLVDKDKTPSVRFKLRISYPLYESTVFEELVTNVFNGNMIPYQISSAEVEFIVNEMPRFLDAEVIK